MRVGYFADNAGYIPISDDQQDIVGKTLLSVIAWSLRLRIWKNTKGVYWLSQKNKLSITSIRLLLNNGRKYLIAGINDWAVAFEAAGFKNAIVGKEWPENDTTMSLEDKRYKVLRYLPFGYS
jgi:hypothetical protein